MSNVDNTFVARRQEQLEDELGDSEVFNDGELCEFTLDTEELVKYDEERKAFTFEINDPDALQEAMRMLLAGEIVHPPCAPEWDITID